MIPRVDFTSRDYTAYAIDIRYNLKTGWVAIPVAGPDGTPVEMVKVHAAIQTKVVSWTCERLDAFPVCPHWNPANSNEVLLEKDIIPTTPTPGMGGRIWRTSGLYRYQLLVPLGDNDSLVCGAMPCSDDTVGGNYLPMNVFKENIIGPAPGPSFTGTK